MLFPHNPYSLGHIAKETIAEYLREAEVSHWVNESRPHRQSWLSDHVHQGLQELRLRVTIGRRLRRIETHSA